MAFTSRELRAGSARVFAIIVDPLTYPKWLVGTESIRGIDDAWPAPGSAFRHRVGFGPFRIADSTTVIEVDDGLMLRLKVKARPFISAVATFRVIGDERRCVVTLQEEPDIRWLGNIVRPVMDPSMHARNHRSLRRLAALAEGGPSYGRTSSSAVAPDRDRRMEPA